MVHHYFALPHPMCCIHMLSLHSLHCYAIIPFKHILFGYSCLDFGCRT